MRYVKRGFLPGRSFDHLADLSSQWEEWGGEVADLKPHETTGRAPLEAWEEEKGHLQPVAEEGAR